MAAFWAGTVPVLAVIGAGAQRLTALAGRRLQIGDAILVIALGAATAAGLWRLGAAPGLYRPSGSLEDAARQVDDLRRQEPPCCRHDS